MLKFASFQITSKVLVPRNLSGRGLKRWAHRHHFDYEPRPGYLYVRSRAISSRCNDNYDEFPADEIEKAYGSFVGKPVFVNHHNDNHRRARGVIIDAALHKDALPDGAPDTWVEVLMEVDAVKFPKLAQAILAGHIDRTSMGTDVAFSVCSVCNNKATTPAEYCQHIPKMKGQRVYRTTASGRKEGILVREICHGLKFFENSLLVEEPADPTAFFLGVEAGPGVKTAAKQAAFCDITHDPKWSPQEWSDHFREVHGYDDATSPYTPPMSSHDLHQSLRDDEDAHPHVHAKTASKHSFMDFAKTAYGEIKAPSTVDTLRDEECPVCGEKDAFDGNECQVCGYVAPPEMFRDPDLDLASELDLRKDVAQDAASDPNGDGMPDKGLDPDQKMQYPTAPGMPGDTGEQADPNAPEMGGSMPLDPEGLPDPEPEVDAFGNPLSPANNVGPNGEQQPVSQQQVGPLDPMLQQPPGPQDTDGDGTVNVSIPQSDVTAPDGQIYEAPQPETDMTSTLVCPACGFEAPAAPPMSVSTDQQASDPLAAVADGLVEGDVCPNCGQAALTTAAAQQQAAVFAGAPDQLSAPVGLGDSPTKGREASRHNHILEGVSVEMSRPVLAAVQSQQKVIEQQGHVIEALRREAVVLKSQMAYLAKLAGVSAQFAAIRKRADELNPGQPVPDPPSQGPSETTEQALAPETSDNVQNLGETPGSVNELGAEKTTSPVVPGEELPVDPFTNMVDVTAPVAGTETHVPLNQTKIETDVRVGDPDNPEVAFPWTLDAGGQQAKAANRTMAALRLARLQVAAGLASGDDLAVAASIESSSVSDHDIETQIATLSAVTKAARRQSARPTSAVPKVASVTRTVPSLSPEAAPLSATAGLGPDVDDADLFF